MSKISPRVDIAFKKIFGVEENKDLLISLINSIVSKEDQVKEVTLLNPHNPQNFRMDKISILDIKAVCQDGKRFNIEIQISDDGDYDKRALYYWGKVYTEQLRISQDYGSLTKAIGIHILNFISIPKAKKYHNVFHITEQEEGFRHFEDLELHTIELKKFCSDKDAELSDIVGKVKSALDIWTAFLTRNELLRVDNLPEALDKPELKKAIGILEVMNFTDEEREVYEGQLKWLMIEASTIRKYQKDAMKEGMEKGVKKGIKMGMREGVKKGKAEVAKKLLAQNIDIGAISAATGLSVEEIRKL